MNSIKAEKKRNKKIRKKNKRIYKFLFFAGFIFLFLQYILFERTSIDFIFLVSLIGVFGIIGAYFDCNRYSFTYKVDGYLSYFLSFCNSAIILGGFLGFLFLAINFYFAESLTNKMDYKIIERHSVSGRKYNRSERKPVFTILFNNKEKEIKYNHSYFKAMNNFKTITIESAKGFFGFDVIVTKTLNK
jgi:hypothetical protein